MPVQWDLVCVEQRKTSRTLTFGSDFSVVLQMTMVPWQLAEEWLHSDLIYQHHRSLFECSMSPSCLLDGSGSRDSGIRPDNSAIGVRALSVTRWS